MSVSISIVPFSHSMAVYGEPDRHAAYSLSGYVRISLSPSFYSSYLQRQRAVSAILQSLIVTFEGQSELVTEETGYSSFRVCSISQELVPEEAIELNNEGHDESSGLPCTWNVVFDLTIPGWLPETSTFGQRNSGTRYALYAAAILYNDDHCGSSSWISTFCSPFRSQTRIVKAPHVSIQLSRYCTPPSTISEPASLWPFAQYSSVAPEIIKTGNPFPIDLSKLLVQVSVPDYVDMEESCIPFALRMRTDGLSEIESNRLRVTDFDVELEQCERYRTTPLDAYVTHFPVPPRRQQPPYLPLLDPHPVNALYELGLAAAPPVTHNITRTFSLLPEDASGHYVIAGDGYAFKTSTDAAFADSWFSLQTSVGVARRSQSSKVDNDSWKCHRVLRPSSQSPFFGVSHRMHVTLTCTYDLNDGENPQRMPHQLRFYLPLRFVRTQAEAHPGSRFPSPTTIGHAQSLGDCSDASAILDLPKQSSPYASSLPAYSQLFDSNGDRKIDYTIPLPIYTPSPSGADLILSKSPTFLDGPDLSIL